MISRNVRFFVATVFGAALFWGALVQLSDVPSSSATGWMTEADEPHPGLRDDELKQALREDWSHEELGYWQARKQLFTEIDGNGRKARGRYTGQTVRYFRQPLPNKMMTEHAWELTRLPARARTDLHHLFPVIPEANGARLNFHYGKVVFAVWSQGGSKSGPSSKVTPVFQVRKSHRGNVARSMFYISTMYDRPIPEREEQILKRWHDQDPVDTREQHRNDEVAALQESRNPFVDHPGLVDRISDF